MTVSVRRQRIVDRPAIHAVIEAAFGRTDEAELVDRLEQSGDLAIGLVAVDGASIIGHVALSRMCSPDCSLGLAPVSVLPEKSRAILMSAVERA